MPVPTTAEATGVVATAQTATIRPETFDPNATPTPTPPVTPFPTPQPYGLANLIYMVVDQLGRPDWCDPDFYPLPRADQVQLAKAHLAEMQADPALYNAILQHNGFTSDTQLTDDQLVTVYGDWKILTKAVVLTASPDGYSFDYVALRGPAAQQTDYHVFGMVTQAGVVTTTTDEPTSAPNCPICVARGTLIDTPAGPVQVQDISVGTVVWTWDGYAARVSAPVVSIGSTPVPPTHQVVHLVLADGRILDVSPGHPLATGRLAGSLVAGAEVDGSVVVSADLVAYSGGATFDLLPAGPTGVYWANGIPLGSTLIAH